MAFLEELASTVMDSGEAFLLSAGSVRLLARNIAMQNEQYYSSIQSLKRHGFIKKVNQNQFLITPKGIRRARILAAENLAKSKTSGVKNWLVVIFDIPDERKKERNILRSVLKRNGFIGIQKSVFISPMVDFSKLILLREELNISKYVTFMEARVADSEDDTALKRKFKSS